MSKEIRKYIRKVLSESFEEIGNTSIEEVFDLIEYADSFRDLYPGYSEEENEYEEEYYFLSKEAAYEEVESVIGLFRSLPNPIPIYRAIRVKSLEDIDYDYIGDSWSFEKQSALNFAKIQNGGNVLLSAFIDKSGVDWKETLRNFFHFSRFPDEGSEDEIKVEDFNKIRDIKVNWIKDIVSEGSDIKLNRYLYHSSSINNRKRIEKNGIIPYRGEQWLSDTKINGPAVFATNSDNKSDWFDSTWDDDVWRIDTKKLRGIKWFLDPNADNGVWIYTKQLIPRDAIELIKKGTGKDLLEIESNKLEIPQIPNTMNFWHGGNLDDYSDIIAQKNGRYEYGPGLYATTSYEVVKNYTRGSRKLYLLSIEKGQDISDALIPEENVKNFIKSYVISAKRKEIWERVQKFNKDGMIKAYNFNIILLNEKAIKSSNTKDLRSFYVDNGIDYEMVHNAFGWGEEMIVLYNMNKIKKTIQVKPTDKIEKYELHK